MQSWSCKHEFLYHWIGDENVGRGVHGERSNGGGVIGRVSPDVTEGIREGPGLSLLTWILQRDFGWSFCLPTPKVKPRNSVSYPISTY